MDGERHGVLYNWGIALGDRAERAATRGDGDAARKLWDEAIDKYERASRTTASGTVTTQQATQGLNNLGLAYQSRAACVDFERAAKSLEATQRAREERVRLLSAGVRKFRRALRLDPSFDRAAYNLGTAVYALSVEYASMARLYPQDASLAPLSKDYAVAAAIYVGLALANEPHNDVYATSYGIVKRLAPSPRVFDERFLCASDDAPRRRRPRRPSRPRRPLPPRAPRSPIPPSPSLDVPPRRDRVPRARRGRVARVGRRPRPPRRRRSRRPPMASCVSQSPRSRQGHRRRRSRARFSAPPTRGRRSRRLRVVSLRAMHDVRRDPSTRRDPPHRAVSVSLISSRRVHFFAHAARSSSSRVRHRRAVTARRARSSGARARRARPSPRARPTRETARRARDDDDDEGGRGSVGDADDDARTRGRRERRRTRERWCLDSESARAR